MGTNQERPDAKNHDIGDVNVCQSSDPIAANIELVEEEISDASGQSLPGETIVEISDSEIGQVKDAQYLKHLCF